MRKGRLSNTLERWLPDAARREWYRPALDDLYAEHLQHGRIGPAYSLRVILLWLECLRLSAAEHLVHLLTRRGAPGQGASKEGSIQMFAANIRHALRIFWREPAFAATAVVTLTLGIGANAALFAVVEAVLLRPLPLIAADDIVVLRHRDDDTGITKQFIALGDFVDLHERQQSLEALASWPRMEGSSRRCSKAPSRCVSRAWAPRRRCSPRSASSRRWGASSRRTMCARTPRRS
jgi:hypothetical protein